MSKCSRSGFGNTCGEIEIKCANNRFITFENRNKFGSVGDRGEDEWEGEQMRTSTQMSQGNSLVLGSTHVQ